MKKIFLFYITLFTLIAFFANAQRKCGLPDYINYKRTEEPELGTRIEQNKIILKEKAAKIIEERKSGNNERTSSITAIPVIFHIVIDTLKYNQLGGDAGIKQRCDSQISVLNRDFNALNADSTAIPAGWKSLFASTGIHFGLAHTDPNGNSTPGYEVRIISSIGFNGWTNHYSDAKHSTLGSGATSLSPGLDAWDVTKYLNVWCINFLDGMGLGGITLSKFFTVSGGGTSPDNEEGIALKWNVFGKRVLSSDNYTPTGTGTFFDEGRTMTHECGHFFELSHVWGDDGSLCPWSSGGHDDGIDDTPPQSTHTSGNPSYTITGGTINDACQFYGTVDTQHYGIACLDFMDYTDDTGMHLFTPQQAAVMVSCVTTVAGVDGENITLVQHPNLLGWPAGVSKIEIDRELKIFPNPSNGLINIAYNTNADKLIKVSILDVIGNEIRINSIDYNNAISIYLSNFSTGVYFIKCDFEKGSVVKRLILNKE